MRRLGAAVVCQHLRLSLPPVRNTSSAVHCVGGLDYHSPEHCLHGGLLGVVCGWCRRDESNAGPPEYKTGALPTELQRLEYEIIALPKGHPIHPWQTPRFGDAFGHSVASAQDRRRLNTKATGSPLLDSTGRMIAESPEEVGANAIQERARLGWNSPQSLEPFEQFSLSHKGCRLLKAQARPKSIWSGES